MELLKKGDKVALAATARKVTKEEMAPAIEILENWGLIVVQPNGLYLSENQFAGTDNQRSELFQSLLNDKEIKAIFCCRGGYGTIRMVDALDFEFFLESSKWIIGYSDITALHTAIYQKLGYSSIHGPMPINWQPENLHPESLEHLRKTLFDGAQPILFPKHPLNLKEEDAEGAVIGGNLSVLYSILGSKTDPNYDGKILVLEDLDEYLYHIDRMITGLKRANKLNNLAALVVGDFSSMKDNTVPFGKNAYEIIASQLKDYSYPIVFGAPVGHEPKNLSIIMGSRYTLKFNKGVEFKQVKY